MAVSRIMQSSRARRRGEASRLFVARNYLRVAKMNEDVASDALVLARAARDGRERILRDAEREGLAPSAMAMETLGSFSGFVVQFGLALAGALSLLDGRSPDVRSAKAPDGGEVLMLEAAENYGESGFVAVFARRGVRVRARRQFVITSPRLSPLSPPSVALERVVMVDVDGVGSLGSVIDWSGKVNLNGVWGIPCRFPLETGWCGRVRMTPEGAAMSTASDVASALHDVALHFGALRGGSFAGEEFESALGALSDALMEVGS